MENEPLDVSQFQNGPRDEAVHLEIQELTRQIRGVGALFYWIAGLSLLVEVTKVLHLTGIGLLSIFSLALPYQVSMFLQILDLPLMYYYPSFWICYVALSMLFVFCGVMLAHGKRWALLVGISLYVLDGLMLVSMGMYLPLIFHAIFAYSLRRGFTILHSMQGLIRQRT